MQPMILKHDAKNEYFFQEGCYINELSNHSQDTDLSIAQARLNPGNTTQWHCLENTTERYLILNGGGSVEIGELPAQLVVAGDVVLIPPGVAQRITNTGDEDLLFLALCTPRFQPLCYHILEQQEKH
ncbi:MAG: cupin domain-containing protein [Candidatus Thiodiazotropha sp.]|nr:cupin domain-containing protein [Candidatus Thiodiazotropha sp.]MCM8884950.1 cupin domain-containing protein [Candidatus Thiodiazotropha sp.]MCM8920718.1 cupin domain-containing protein [Candidatus Thiodiazotropha sp.]